MGKIIGIDLGTTNSCTAVMEGGKAVVIHNAEGSRTTPSVMAITKNGERLIGDAAKRQSAANPERIVSSIKRHMGTDYSVKIDGKNYLPQKISAQILMKLKEDAKSYLGTEVTEAVITVPAYFNASMSETNINLPFIVVDRGETHHMDIQLTRTKFDELTYSLVSKTEEPVRNALKDAGLSAGEIDRVLMVGGSTRIPAVQRKVAEITGKRPDQSLNPDECVALGAAIQGGKLAGEAGTNEVLLMDVIPLSLSIETMGGMATRIIERNSTIPTRHSQIFTTGANFQTAVDIKVLQGERMMANENKVIGNFRLKGIKRAVRGVPQIEVTFDIDVNGILKVSAKDLGTGKEQSVVITSSSNMSEEEIEQAIQNAKENAAFDEEHKEAVQSYHEAEETLVRADQYLAEHKKEIEKEKKKASFAVRLN